MPKQVVLIPLDQIMRSGRNPRSQLGDLSGLRASLGSPEAALLAQLPVVQPRAAGGYELIVGERRLESARLNGWAEMECVVRDDLTPHRALAARIVENLHRQALHPLDEAFALRVLWLVENAQARGLEREAEQELRRGPSLDEQCAQLEGLLARHGWRAHRPVVTWDTLLDRYGLSLEATARKRLIRLVSLAPEVKTLARHLNLNMAQMNSLARLKRVDQQQLLEAIREQPTLLRRLRSMANWISSGKYDLPTALSVVSGHVSSGAESEPADVRGDLHDHGDLTDRGDLNDRGDHTDRDERAAPGGSARTGRAGVRNYDAAADAVDAVIALIQASNEVAAAIGQLQQVVAGRGLRALPAPYDDLARDALDLIQSEVEPLLGGPHD